MSVDLEAEIGQAISDRLNDKLTSDAFKARLDRLIEENPEQYAELQQRTLDDRYPSMDA
jgi:hypothetical protein